ncbi:MAG: MFS transporter, partial [Desulfobacteraceae bacterium]
RGFLQLRLELGAWGRVLMNESDCLEQPSADPHYKWKVLATVAMGATMATLDASITNIAFPVLTEVFQAELTTIMWVTLAYILVSTSSMLLVGKISDHIGRKRIYALGMALFSLGLLFCSISQNIEQLVFSRAFQALGAAMTVACGTALVTEAFPLGEIGRGLGLLGVAVSFGFILGPVVGGFLLDWFDWRAIFYVRLPIGVITFFMAAFLLKEGRRKPGRLHLDILGALTSSGGLFCLVFGVSQLRRYGIHSPLVHILIGSGLLIFIVFIWVERRAYDPIVDLELFKNRTFSSASAALFLVFAAAPAHILIMPFYLMQGILLNPSRAGLLLAVHSVTTMIFGPISGWLSDRFGPSRFAILGAAALASAFFLMRSFEIQTPVAVIVPVLILSGIGVGAFQAPNNSMIMGGVPGNRLGTASALIATLRQVGISVGMAIAGTVFAARQAAYELGFAEAGEPVSHAARLAIPPAFHEVLLISGSLVVLVIVFSILGAPWGKKASPYRFPASGSAGSSTGD